MNAIQRIINAVRSAIAPEPPRPGRVVLPRAEDFWRDYPADGLTPARLAAILRRADDGALDEAMQLYEQMEEKDAHLHSVAATRRLALTGLEWEIVSAAELMPIADRAAADAAAQYCSQALRAISDFDDALQHLSLALGRNIAVAELVWEERGGALVLDRVIPVDFTRLVFDDLGRLRILTADDPREGLAPPPHKFVVHTPGAASGHPSRGGLLRATALAFLAKQYALKDWLIYAEVFGMPVRIARYDPRATAMEKRELLEMLRNFGTDAAGVFSKAVDLQILDANRGTPPPPFEAMASFFNREMSKAWLGQTLTVDPAGAPGSFSAARIHEEVRADLRLDDIRREGRTLRRDLLAPLTQLRFGPDVPVPIFRRRLRDAGDVEALARLLATAVNDLGLAVPRRWVHQALGVPEAAAGDEPLSGRRSALSSES